MRAPKVRAEASVEYLIPFAKRELKRWRSRLLVSSSFKRLYLDANTYIDMRFDGDQEFIRIFGGGIVYLGHRMEDFDAFYPLWADVNAVIPMTAEDVVPAIDWSPVVQHITANYTTPEPGFMVRHWLVICRYTQRVASYTWDEVHTVSDSDTPIIVNQYVTHASDGTSVSLLDTDEFGATTPHDVTLDLVGDAEANPWGVIAEGPSEFHPGPEPDAALVASVLIHTQDGDGNDFIIGVTGGLNDLANVRYELVEGPSNTLLDSLDVPSSDTSEGFPDGTFGAPNGFPDERITIVGDIPAPDFNTILVPGVYDNTTPPTQSNANYQTFLDAADARNIENNDAYDAAYEAWLVATVTTATALYQDILAKMDAKRFGVASDLTELAVPPDGDFGLLSTLVVPLISTANYTATLDVDHTQDFVYASGHIDAVPDDIYGVTFDLTDPVDPAPPEVPWTASFSALDSYTYSTATRAYTRATAVPLLNTYFSRSVAVPMTFGSLEAVPYTGFYAFTSGSGYDDEYNETLNAPIIDPEDTPIPDEFVLDPQMATLCLRASETSYCDFGIFKAFHGGPGALYRATAHEHVIGDYSFTQPAVV